MYASKTFKIATTVCWSQLVILFLRQSWVTDIREKGPWELSITWKFSELLLSWFIFSILINSVNVSRSYYKRYFTALVLQLLGIEELSIYWNPHLKDESLIRNRLATSAWRVSTIFHLIVMCISWLFFVKRKSWLFIFSLLPHGYWFLSYCFIWNFMSVLSYHLTVACIQ